MSFDYRQAYRNIRILKQVQTFLVSSEGSSLLILSVLAKPYSEGKVVFVGISFLATLEFLEYAVKNTSQGGKKLD